jgi:hypothetical protein
VLCNASQLAISYPAEYIRNSGNYVWSDPKPHLICDDGNELYKYDFNMNSICDSTGDIVGQAGSVCTVGYIDKINRCIYVPDGVAVKISVFNDANAFMREETHDSSFILAVSTGEQYRLSIYWTATPSDISEYTVNKDYFLMKTSIMMYPTDFGIVDLINSMVKG